MTLHQRKSTVSKRGNQNLPLLLVGRLNNPLSFLAKLGSNYDLQSASRHDGEKIHEHLYRSSIVRASDSPLGRASRILNAELIFVSQELCVNRTVQPTHL